ncbi:MFS transporter [Acinetobacter soli]|nr:MFS transporter [Acinetobacter soli]
MSLKLWIALIVLSLSSFAIVTTELAPIGLLSALAHDLNQSEAITGLIVTGYGWVAAISALCSIVLLIRFPRKMVLMIMLLILAISNIIVAYSSSFNMIFSARIIGAIAHGSFWALIGAVAYSLVPKHKLGLATSIIFSGVSVASILGVPLASYLTQLSSWRLAFEFLGLLSFIVCILILLFVPKIPDQAPLASGFFKKCFSIRL